jgi:hypothetical protein
LLLPSQALVLTTLASNAIVQRARLRMWPGQPLVARAWAYDLGQARGKPVSVNIEPVSGTPKRKLENGEQRLARQSHQSSPEIPECAC